MDSFQPGPLFPGNERSIVTPSPAADSARAGKAASTSEAPVPAYTPAAEPTSATSAMGTIDNLFTLLRLPLGSFTIAAPLSCPRGPRGWADRTDAPGPPTMPPAGTAACGGELAWPSEQRQRRHAGEQQGARHQRRQ